MLVKTRELTESALEWVVAQIEYSPEEVKIFSGNKYPHLVRVLNKTFGVHTSYFPSTSHCQGGPIIEKHLITTTNGMTPNGITWTAIINYGLDPDKPMVSAEGKTLLIAAMRCLAVNHFGENVDIPEELCNRT